MNPITKHDPFRNIFSFPHFLDDFESFGSHKGLKIRETENSIEVEAVVAGVPSKNVEVHIEDGVLTIKAESEKEKEAKQEYSSHIYKYYYTAALSGGQWDKAAAKIRDGVVKISVPKAESVKPRKIKVNTHEEE